MRISLSFRRAFRNIESILCCLFWETGPARQKQDNVSMGFLHPLGAKPFADAGIQRQLTTLSSRLDAAPNIL